MTAIHSAPRYAPQENPNSWKTTVSVEKWRCIAYGFFWTMCLFALTMTKLFVVDYLKAGPDPDLPIEKQGCGPFNREDVREFGVGLGEGFNYTTQSHLIELFGFGNICTAWDYSPSRELTALYFPLFEYSLVIYLVLDIANTYLTRQRGEISEAFWNFSKTVGMINIALCICFRMIFVCIAYEEPAKHTAGFLGLQVALILVAIQNTLYVIMTGQSYPTVGLSSSTTAVLAKIYLFLLSCISAVKVAATVYIVLNGVGPAFYKKDSPIPGQCVGQIVDKIWMIFNAVLPMCIAFIRMKNEDPLTIEISMPTPTYEGATAAGKGENAPLTGTSTYN